MWRKGLPARVRGTVWQVGAWAGGGAFARFAL